MFFFSNIKRPTYTSPLPPYTLLCLSLVCVCLFECSFFSFISSFVSSLFLRFMSHSYFLRLLLLISCPALHSYSPFFPSWTAVRYDPMFFHPHTAWLHPSFSHSLLYSSSASRFTSYPPSLLSCLSFPFFDLRFFFCPFRLLFIALNFIVLPL